MISQSSFVLMYHLLITRNVFLLLPGFLTLNSGQMKEVGKDDEKWQNISIR